MNTTATTWNVNHRLVSITTVWLCLMLCACAEKNIRIDKASVETTSSTHQAVVEGAGKALYEEARQLMLEKNYPLAEAGLQKIVAKFPNQSGAWANLGIIYSETNRLELAEKALKKSIENDQKNAEVYLRLASVYKQQGKLDEAIKACKESIEVDSRNAKAHYNIAILYDIYLQDKPLALSHLKKYVEITGQKDKETLAWIRQIERDNQRQQTAGVQP